MVPRSRSAFGGAKAWRTIASVSEGFMANADRQRIVVKSDLIKSEPNDRAANDAATLQQRLVSSAP